MEIIVKINYEAPKVEAIVLSVEKGFAQSYSTEEELSYEEYNDWM